jgi:RNA polymerase-binding protein DksA
MVEHAELKQLLLARLRALERRVEKITGNLRHESEPLEGDFEEQAVQRENDEVLGALDDAGRRELAAIRASLARMEAGTYGTCVACGEPIAPERLRVLPTALRCVECAA